MTSYGYIIIPYCQHGTLLDLLIKKTKAGGLFSEATQTFLCRQVVEAVHVLHNLNKRAHMDLKVENIVIRDLDTFELGLIDFAHLQHSKVEITEFNLGTPNYLPPEVEEAYYMQKPYTPERADMYCVGIIFYMILNL